MALVLAACGSDDKQASDGKGGDSEVTIGVLQASSAGSVQRMLKAVNLSADALGWEVKTANAEGDPAKASQIMQSFVNDQVDAIIDISFPGAPIAPQLDAAKKAGIPTFEPGNADDPSVVSKFSGVYAPDFVEGGKLIAEDVMANGTEPGDILIQQFANYTIQYGFVKGMLDVLEPEGFKPVVAAIDIKNIAGSLQTTARQSILAHPDAPLFVGGFSASPAAIIPVLDEQKNTNMQVYGLFDEPDAMDFVRQGKNLSLLAYDYPVGVFIAMDQIRAFIEDGTPVDPKASDGKFQAAIVNKSNVTADGYFFPDDDIAKPWLDKWAADK